jgi:hypothetical protein
MTAKKQYNLLLKQGSLLDLYETLTGVWEEDKNKFQELWEMEESFINNIEVEDYEQYEEY